MHNDALRSPRWWLFQSNPNYYDLLGAMDAMMESAWAVTRFGKEMAPGDRVFLWETGPAGGIRGLATITGPLRPRPSVDPDAEFVLAPDKVPTGQEVPIDFNMTFPEGPGRRTLRVHPLLSQMSHMSQPRPTNHRVAPEQATALLELLDLVPKGIPAFKDDVLAGGQVDFDVAFGQFLAHLPGAELGTLKSAVRVRDANEHWIDLLPTKSTGRIALPTGLVREWLLAADEGLFNDVTKSRRMRELVVSRGSEWANYHHGFDGKLKALVEAWLDFRSQRLQLPLGVTPVAARPTPDPLPAIHQTFSDALREAGLHFGPPSRHDAFTRAFLASVLTKRFVLLTGLSGSGKSQVALRFGDFLGPGRSCIVPVRPDWTSPESLLGFPDLLRKAPDSESVPWHTPPTLEFILRAQASDELHLLILDEMNLAHVERYFADVLSGIESDAPCIPALTRVGDQWMSRGGARMPLPKNLVIIGTVNVDETTYMFSPKVLDRANTLEFRVQTDDLPDDPSELRPPGPLPPASAAALAGLQAVLVDPSWSGDGESQPAIGPHLKALHAKLAVSGFEFGHRVYFEAHRFARIHRALGGGGVREALDLQVMQKVLPRLHGSRRRVEGVLLELARFAFFGRVVDAGDFAPQSPPKDTEPVLPQSFDKLQRMLRRLAANQFVSFSE